MSIQNLMGPEGIQQLALILPKDFEVAEESEEPYSVEEVGDFEITVWQKKVKRNENYRVDLVIERN